MNELRDVEAQLVPLDSLKAYDGNAKRHDSDNIDAIANSISEFGFRNPILAWHNEDGVPEIVAGHGRAAAAKKLRMEQVPVIFVDDLTDAQRRMLTLADNQTTLMTGWDDQTLQEELDALTDVFDVAGFGFDIDEIIGDDGVEVTEDEPDDDAEDRVKPGELWRMGGHVLLCGDSTDADGIARLMSAMPEVGGGCGCRPATDRPTVQRGSRAAWQAERSEAAASPHRRASHRQRQLGRRRVLRRVPALGAH